MHIFLFIIKMMSFYLQNNLIVWRFFVNKNNMKFEYNELNHAVPGSRNSAELIKYKLGFRT